MTFIADILEIMRQENKAATLSVRKWVSALKIVKGMFPKSTLFVDSEFNCLPQMNLQDFYKVMEKKQAPKRACAPKNWPSK